MMICRKLEGPVPGGCCNKGRLGDPALPIPSPEFCIPHSDSCLLSFVFRLPSSFYPKKKSLGPLPARGCRMWQSSFGYLLLKPLFPILCKFVDVVLGYRDQLSFHECFLGLFV